MYFATFNRWDTKEGKENFPSFKISNVSHKVPLNIKIYAVRLYACLLYTSDAADE